VSYLYETPTQKHTISLKYLVFTLLLLIQFCGLLEFFCFKTLFYLICQRKTSFATTVVIENLALSVEHKTSRTALISFLVKQCTVKCYVGKVCIVLVVSDDKLYTTMPSTSNTRSPIVVTKIDLNTCNEK